MLWITEIDAVRRLVIETQRNGKKVGLVPTMGNLHAGHASLMRQARQETDFVVATIFVNPLQFGPKEDFDRYPRTPEQDRAICAAEGVDAIFAPDRATMYPPDAVTRVQVTGLEEPLCGKSRPGHFVGVATVVAKLFNIIPADIGFFGRKDYQQASLIRRMARDLDFPIEVRLCDTVREPDGLAMSSRNGYLSPAERQQAISLRQALDRAEKLVASGDRDPKAIVQKMTDLLSSYPLARIDYVEIVDPETFRTIDRIDRPALAALAVFFGKTRLIDNATLTP